MPPYTGGFFICDLSSKKPSQTDRLFSLHLDSPYKKEASTKKPPRTSGRFSINR